MVTLDAFYMDIFEVSNQQYTDFLNIALAEGRITVAFSGVVYQIGGAGEALCDTSMSTPRSRINWNGSSFETMLAKGDHPMSNVSWHGACAYANGRSRAKGLTPCYNEGTWECDFNADGFRLPTEAEWEYATRGGEHDPYYYYPWGNEIDGSHANFKESGDPYETTNSNSWPWATPVAYYGGDQNPAGVDMANGYGLHGMAGNLWEWCHDWYLDSYYGSSPMSNPTGPASGTEHVIRGGGWFSLGWHLRSANRESVNPIFRSSSYGFRVLAVSP